MSNDPEEIRRQIEATRAELSQDVNALGEKVSPTEIAKRQKEKLWGTISSVKETVMGSADSATSSAGQALSSAGDAAAQVPGTVVDKTRGNPMAAGVIAFGVGLLVSSLIPASKPETRAAAAIKEQAQPLVEEVTSAAKEIAGNLQEPAQEAAQSVKYTAQDAVATVKDEGGSAVGDVKAQAADAKDTVQNAR